MCVRVRVRVLLLPPQLNVTRNTGLVLSSVALVSKSFFIRLVFFSLIVIYFY